MADLFHYFQIHAPLDKVYEHLSTAQGFDKWWSERAEGKPNPGETFHFHFGSGYDWSAVVSEYVPGQKFELTMTKADEDWLGSKVGFRLAEKNNTTDVQFYHTGWKEDNEHYRISNYCWAMYLRVLKRYLEFGEFVPYENRLSV